MKQTCRCGTDSLFLQLQPFCSQLDCNFDFSLSFLLTLYLTDIITCSVVSLRDMLTVKSPLRPWKDSIELIKTLVWQTVKIRFRGEGIVSELVLPHKPHVVSSEVAPAVLLTPQASTLYFFTSVAARRLRVSVSAAAALIGEHKCCCHSGGWHRLIHARLDHSHAV